MKYVKLELFWYGFLVCIKLRNISQVLLVSEFINFHIIYCSYKMQHSGNSFSAYAKCPGKLTLLTPLIRTRMCAYQGLRNVSFS